MGEGYGRVPELDAVVEKLPSGLALRWLGGGGRWAFDEAGRPVSISRGPGTEVRLGHDADGRLIELAHAGGKRVRVAWDEAAERISGLECSDGRAVSYRYDVSNDLEEVDGAGGTRRYELDAGGRVVSVIDADGVVELVNTYDDDGRVLEQLSPFGRRTHISYLPGRVTVTMDDDEDGPVNTYVHDVAGRLIAIVDGDDQQMAMSYDEWGNPASVTERNGAVTFQDWDERGRLVRRVLPTGVTFRFAHDDADRLVEVAVSTGAVTRLGYSGDERIPAEIVGPEGGVTRQVVEQGLVRRIVDPDGMTVDLAFDADGNVVAATNGDGNSALLERDAAGRVTALVSPLGRRSTFFYDQNGLLVERHDAAGGEWRYERTAAGRLTSVTDPAGAREETRYGEHGMPTATVDALGHVTEREYDAFGNVVGVVEPDGAAWRYTYDALMRLTAIVDPTGASWRREYDVNGTLVACVDPAGVRVTATLDQFGRVIGVQDGVVSLSYELDALGRVVAQRGPDGARARDEYDLCGRRTLIEDATGAITRLEYTPAGRVACRVSPSGRRETFEHDACGRLAARVDGAGRRWEVRYDADGEVAEVVLPTGEVERFERDDAGRLMTASSPGEGRSSFAYDAAGRLTAVTDRDGGERRYGYDAAGNLVAATDANDAKTRYTYNERGWVTEVVDPLGGVLAGRYDPVGRIVEFRDQLGRASTCAYDPAGRLLELVDGAGGSSHRSYDVSGRLKSFGVTGLPAVTIDCDALGRVVAVDEPGSPVITQAWDAAGRLVERRRGELAMRWEYDADGRRAAIGYPDGTKTSYTHDAGGYVVAAQHPALGTIELERDAAGRVTAANADGMRGLWRYEDGDLVHYEMQAGGSLRTAHLTRDPIGRVVQATIDDAAHAFAYDDAGQLVSADTPEGAYAFSYDPNGRLARESSPAGVAEYQYDAAGQLSACVRGDGLVTRYDYDGAGRRVHESGPGLDRAYHWDGLGRLTAVVSACDGDEPRTVDVVVDALGELAALDGTAVLWDTAHPLQPLAWNGAGAVVGEGAPWALATVAGAQWLAPDWQATVGETPRDPWGAPRAPAAGTSGVALGFRGEVEFDAETWLRHRVYQPGSRSFLQRDPLAPVPGSPAAGNPYHYAANNAVALSDPLGLRPVTERELQSIRDRMNRGAIDSVVDSSGEIGLALSIAAIFVPGGGIVLGGAALVFTAVSAIKAAKERDELGVALDLAGVVPGVGALSKGYKAGRATRAATRLRGEARGTATQALRTKAITGLDAVAQQRIDDAARAMLESARSAAKRDRLLELAERYDRIGLSPSVASFARERAQELKARGIDLPFVRDPRPPLVLPAR
jgi:RHS repeat-associated protein